MNVVFNKEIKLQFIDQLTSLIIRINLLLGKAMKIRQPKKNEKKKHIDEATAQDVIKALSLESLAYYLSVCSDQDWAKKQRERALSLLKFLEENQLLAKESSLSSAHFDDDFELFEKDLNEEGCRLYEEAISDWDDAIDQGLNPSNIKILSDYLKQIKHES